MSRKNQKIDFQKTMDNLGAILLEDAVNNNCDEALDLLEKCMIPVGVPPIPWRGIVFQLRKSGLEANVGSIFLERGYNKRFLPMII